MSKLLIAFSVSILISVNGFAINYTWIGATSTAWNTNTNWSPTGIPGASDNVTINNGALLNQPVLPSNKTISNFTISAGSLNLAGFQLFMSGNVTCSGGTVNTSGTSGAFHPINALTVIFSGTVFNAAVNTLAFDIYFNGGIFNGLANLFTKTGNSNNISIGGCVFNNSTVGIGGVFNNIVNNSTGEIRLGNVNPDIFNGPAVFNNNSSGTINVAYNALNNQFNQNITVVSTGTGSINFSQGTGTSLLANGMTLATTTFSFGNLRLRNFTQIGTTPQNLTLTGSSSLYFETGTAFNGSLIISTPNLFLNGSTFNGASNQFTQTGTTLNSSVGGNIFAGATSNSIINSGSGEIRMGNTNPDIFNGPANFNITSSGTINLGYNSLNNQFNDNILVTSIGTGTIAFGQGIGTSFLSSGKTISSGTFSSGVLRLRNFTQTSNLLINNLILSGSSTIFFETGTAFDGQIYCYSPNIYLNGAIFYNHCDFIKVGGSNNLSDGGNYFKNCVFINSSSTDFTFGVINPDTFFGTTLFSSNGSGYLDIAYSSVGNMFFSGDIIVSSSSSSGIYFGFGGGTTFINSNDLIANNFTDGPLALFNVNYAFNMNLFPNLTLTTNASFISNNSTYSVILDITAPSIELSNSNFNDLSSFTKTGSTNDFCFGNNNFNGAAIFENQSLIGELYLSVGGSDNYFNAVQYSGVGKIRPAYSANSYYYKDVYTTPLTFFGTAGGTASINGATDQTFYSDFTTSTSVANLSVQSSSTCFFNGKTQVTNQLNFISGYVNATETEPLTLTETATITTPASDLSHSTGYIQKIGNSAFEFPVGNGTYFMPISISAPANNTDAFTANYVDTSSHTLYSHFLKEPSIDNISDCHYWNLNRDAGTSDVFVTVGWNNAYNLCEVTEPNDLVVAHWNSSIPIWEDYGNGGTTGTAAAGTITTSMPVNNFSPITLASISGLNVLPIELVSFTAEAKIDFVEINWITASELNNDFFNVERSFDGINFQSIAIVNSKAETGNSTQALAYKTIDDDKLDGVIYYRLKQTDFDGVFEYSNTVSVIMNTESNDMMIQPNPNNGSFNLMFSTSNLGEGTIQIYSSNGETIRTEIVQMTDGTQTKWIDFSDLPKGVYILKFYTKDKVITEKLVVN